MRNTFYGVDIILLPKDKRGKELYEQGKVIEMNGLTSGASFNKINDYEFYKRVMREIRQNTGDKLILFGFDPEWNFKKEESPEMKKSKEEEHAENLARTRRWEEHLSDNSRSNFFSVHDFLVEKLDWKNKSKDRFKTNSTYFYIQAAKELGMNIDQMTSFFSFSGLLRYVSKIIDPCFLAKLDMDKLKADKPLIKFAYGEIPPFRLEEKYVTTEQVGLIWDDFSKDIEAYTGEDKFFNGFFAQAVLGEKSLFYLYSQFLPPEERTLERFLPRSFLYGLGLHSQKGFRKWMESIEGNIFVKKPLAEAHGIGVEFLTREEMKKYDRSPFYDESHAAIERGYIKSVMEFILSHLRLQEEAVIFQEAIESKKIRDYESGKEYPTCARAIVVNGRYMGAIWRSNKKDTGNLTEMLRHNITNGAEVLPVSDEDDRILGELAEAVVHEFEKTNERVKEVFHDKQVHPYDMFKDYSIIEHDAVKIQSFLYLGKMNQVAQEYGVSIPDALNKWLQEVGSGTEIRSSSFVEKVNRFFEQL